MKLDINYDIINSAAYLLRHVKINVRNNFANNSPLIENKLHKSFEYDNPKTRALEYHIHYAASMQGVKESTDWLKEIIRDNDWREIMMLFNLEHAVDSPEKYIRSMNKKVYDPDYQEKDIIEVSRIILSDYEKGLGKYKQL